MKQLNRSQVTEFIEKLITVKKVSIAEAVEIFLKKGIEFEFRISLVDIEHDLNVKYGNVVKVINLNSWVKKNLETVSKNRVDHAIRLRKTS